MTICKPYYHTKKFDFIHHFFVPSVITPNFTFLLLFLKYFVLCMFKVIPLTLNHCLNLTDSLTIATMYVTY